MNRKSFFLSIMLFLIIILNLELIKIPKIESYYEDEYKWSSYQVTSSSDDCYCLVNYDFDNSSISLYIKVLNYDVGTGIRFQNIQLMGNGIIDKAILSVYTDEEEIEDEPTYFSVYGIKGNPTTFQNYTDFIDKMFNITEEQINIDAYDNLQGTGWHNISLTNVVKEVVYNKEINWVNGSLGFIISSEEGYEYVKIRSYDYDDHSKAPKLYIREKYKVWKYGGDPDDYVDDYRGYEIYCKTSWYNKTIVEYIFTEGTETPYNVKYDDIDGIGTHLITTSDGLIGTGICSQRNIIRTSNGTIYVVIYKRSIENVGQVFVKRSLDDGITWIDETQISNATGMTTEWQQYPAIAVDSSDNLHVVWAGIATGYSSNQIWYALNNGTWQTPIRISTYAGMSTRSQLHASIAIFNKGYLHVVWKGLADGYPTNFQIWYALNNGTWQTPVRISTLEGMETEEQILPTIGIDSKEYLHIAWSGHYTVSDNQIWYALYDGTWHTPVKISILDNMKNCIQSSPSIVVDYNNDIHLVWSGKSETFQDGNRIWYALNNGTWQIPIQLSSESMNPYDQSNANIAFNPDGIYVVWDGKATGYIDNTKIWLSIYTDSWSSPECLQSEGRNFNPSIRLIYEYSKHYTVYYEDKFIKTCFTTEDEYEDWIDWYEDFGTDQLPNLGSNIFWLMGILGLGLIPLSFIMFIWNIQHGDIENAFYLLMVLFMIGLSLVIGWLWA